MKIFDLTCNNFRKYENAKFRFHPSFNVLIGDNGAGKTTVLDAVSIMLGTYLQGSRIKTGRGGIVKDDIRYKINRTGGQVFREPQGDASIVCSGKLNGDKILWQRDYGDRGGKAKDLVEIGARHRKMVANGDSPDLPLLLYYGPGRLWDIHRNIKIEGPDSQLDAYRFCLDPKSDQKAFEKWFKKLSISALRKNGDSQALANVEMAVKACIPDSTDFFFDIDEDQIMLESEKTGLIPVNYLGDGFRNIIAMTADIAHRASRLNPQYEIKAAQKTSGIVLIDEIDMHLHPKWQRRVVGDLKQAFPNIQFIATTHSPFIIQSLNPGEVIDLNQEASPEKIESYPPDIAAPGPGCSFANRSIEDIVEEIMGIEKPQRSKRYQDMYNAALEYYKVLEQGKDVDKKTKARLKEKLDILSAPFSENVAYHAFLEMKRTAAGMADASIEDGGQ
ncbi:AAA family ATPase [Desulfatibacillum aliphaticivorans]|uniref:AAA family ATPase n=1 Tax=Desulfatibacillum aliphaticivorans TaxID=218208 RepID=UPI0004846827|nr:AAA family ATPase [Desulfatibacillum aliphaticivorans]